MIWQPNPIEEELIGSQGIWRLKAIDGSGRYQIVLIDAVATDAQAAHRYGHAADRLIEHGTTGKEHYAILVRVGRLMKVRTGMERIKAVDALINGCRPRWPAIEARMGIDTRIIED